MSVLSIRQNNLLGIREGTKALFSIYLMLDPLSLFSPLNCCGSSFFINRRRPSPRRRSPPPSYSRRRSPRRPWSPPANRNTGLGKPGNNLFVAGFSYVTTERDLEKKFSRFGRVTDVRIVRDRR